MMIDSDHTCPFRTHILLGHANFPQEFEDFVGPPLLAPPKPTSAVPLIRWIRRKQSTGKADTVTNTPQFANGTGTSANAPGPVNNSPLDKVRKTLSDNIIIEKKKNVWTEFDPYNIILHPITHARAMLSHHPSTVSPAGLFRTRSTAYPSLSVAFPVPIRVLVCAKTSQAFFRSSLISQRRHFPRRFRSITVLRLSR